MLKIGIDAGSTTLKVAIIDEHGTLLHSAYRRHNAQISDTLIAILTECRHVCLHHNVSLKVTGSVGMGLSERFHIPFVQEVVAASNAIRLENRDINTLIDIGGEDE